MNIEGKIPWFAGASRRKRWLVGVSGGMDSMALLHLLHQEGFRDVVVCHLNHGLRGAESAGMRGLLSGWREKWASRWRWVRSM